VAGGADERRGGTARTTIEIDEQLVATVMRVHGCKTSGEALDFALRQLVLDTMTPEEMLAMQAAGWEATSTPSKARMSRRASERPPAWIGHLPHVRLALF
jgi:Arc/MetJ family transcription regulator